MAWGHMRAAGGSGNSVESWNFSASESNSKNFTSIIQVPFEGSYSVSISFQVPYSGGLVIVTFTHNDVATVLINNTNYGSGTLNFDLDLSVGDTFSVSISTDGKTSSNRNGYTNFLFTKNNLYK